MDIDKLIDMLGSQKFYDWYIEDGGTFHDWHTGCDESTTREDVEDDLRVMLERYKVIE